MKSFLLSVLFSIILASNSHAKSDVSPDCDPTLCNGTGFICKLADNINETCESDSIKEYQRVCACAGWGETLSEISKSEKKLRFSSLEACQKPGGESIKTIISK